MRLALKIAYEGRSFYGHQRQPDVRTVEGECLHALHAAGVVRDARGAFFRSASRTDRGVSAVGNVIAFDTSWKPDAVVGAFNDRAKDVWAWAYASVPETFHPRHALDRWYRYHLFDLLPLEPLRSAAACFVGEHDFRAFTSDPPSSPMALDLVDVTSDGDAIAVDIRARSFRRGMVRRIVAALVGHARGDVEIEAIRASLRGEPHDFGSVPPEPLFLMEVRYEQSFQTVLRPKILSEWKRAERDLSLRRRFLDALPRPREGAANRTESE